ncbi:MAG: FGGY family carbohydrate kinase, partial [Prolixibacteraceae bacterium]|nr:FGGY family carbohydrate kinase [Prolixibacteraceae bacterium]
MNYFIGVDIGTGGCKAVAFDDNGVQVSLSYREYDIISRNPGWAELDPDEVIKKCFAVIKEVTSDLPEDSVKSIGISSQGEAFTILDQKGNSLCNAFVSSDSRADSYVKSWTESFGDEKLYKITGHTSHPMFSLFKLLWIRDNMPNVRDKCSRILCFEDLLQYRLGILNPTISWSLAGRTMLFDVVNWCWSSEILQMTGIKEWQLSKPVPSGSFAGFIDVTIARHLGLNERTMVVSGGHDQTCSAIGAGAVKPGMGVYSAGTVECITAAFDTPVFNDDLKKNNYCTYNHATPGLYATLAFSLTGGNLFKWFRDQFGRKEKEDAERLMSDPYQLLVDQLPEKSSDLLVLPYFTPSGTPYFDTSVKGAILGLDLSTTREELLKALLEGVALEMRLNLELLENAGYKIDKLIAIGGG